MHKINKRRLSTRQSNLEARHASAAKDQRLHRGEKVLCCLETGRQYWIEAEQPWLIGDGCFCSGELLAGAKTTASPAPWKTRQNAVAEQVSRRNTADGGRRKA